MSLDGTNLTEQAEAIFDNTSEHLTFAGFSQDRWPVLYKISQLLHAYSYRIGYPALIVNPQELGPSDRVAKEYSAISMGHDKKFPDVYLWQISLRQEQTRAILHGRSGESGENWRLINFDSQHAKSSVLIRGEASMLTDFILQSMIDSDVLCRVNELHTEHKDHSNVSLALSGLAEVHTARKETVRRGKINEYAQVDATDLPDWIIEFLARPVEKIEIPISHHKGK